MGSDGSMLIMTKKKQGKEISQLDRFRSFEDDWYWKTDDPSEVKVLEELWRTIWSPKYVEEAEELLSGFSDDVVKKLIERRFIATVGLLDGTTKTGNDDMKDYVTSRRLAMDLLFIKVAIEQKRDLSNMLGHSFKNIHELLNEYVKCLGEHSRMKAINLYTMREDLAVGVIQSLRELAYEYQYGNRIKDGKIRKKGR